MYALFNTNDLNLANNYEVLDIDASNPPKVIVNKYQLARADGEVVTNQRYGERTITIKGRILASNRKDMETKLDTLKTYFVGQDKNLDIYVADVTRRFVATCTGFTTTIQGFSCNWIANFTAEAFGKAISTTSLTVTTPYVTSPTADINTFLGTYNARPTFDLTVVGIDPYWTAKYLDIDNTALSKKIRITRIWNWYDRVVINADAKTCSLYASTKQVIDNCDVSTGWTSTHTISLEAALMKEGVGCLKIVMAGAHDHTDFIKLNFSPTIDLGATTGKVIIPIFVPTPSAGAVSKAQLWIGSNTTFGTNYVYWDKSTQFNGSAIATNAWNFFEFDMATAPTGTSGTADRTAIKSILVSIVGTSAAMQLSGAFLDYITLQKAGVTATALDYEGIFPEYAPGSGTITLTDEFTSRRFTYTANYTKRYL